MSLVAWYPLNGNIKNQGIGDMELTQVVTPTFVNGKLGQALNEGAFSWTAEQTEKILNNNELSICLWIYVNAETGSTTNRVQIFGKGGMGEGDNRKFSLLQYPNCNSLHWSWMNDTSNTTFTAGVLENVLPSYQWTHIAVTYKNPTGKIYINGKLKHTFTGTSNSSSFRYSTPVIYNSQYHYLNDYRFYDHCLSVQEVKELSKALILHYPLNSQNGSGNENLLRMGGLVRNSATSTSFDKSTNTYTIVSPVGTSNWGYGVAIGQTNKVIIPYGDSYRFSFEVFVPTEHRIVVDYNNASNDSSVSSWSGNDNDTGRLGNSVTVPANTWKKVVFGSSNTHSGNTSQVAIYDYSSVGIYTANDTEPITWYIRNPKVELGTEVTDWCPNPNDELYTQLGYGDLVEYDTSGYGYDGTLSKQLQYSTDSASGNLSLDLRGTDYTSYIRVPDYPQLEKNFTWNVWIKQNSSTSPVSTQAVLSQGRDYTADHLGFNIFVVNGVPEIRYGYKSQNRNIKTNVTLDNNWHMVTASISQDGVGKIYLDGVLKGTDTNPTYCNYQYATGNLVIGKMSYLYTQTGAYFPFNGLIDDVKLYSTALSDDDVLELYQTKAKIDKNGNMYCGEFIEDEYITTSNIDKKYEINTNQLNEEIDIYDMKTKMLDDGSVWARIHWLDVSSTVEWFKDADEVAHCINKSNRYSRMELVDEFLTVNNNYEFMLTYPSLSDILYNRWTQTSSANVSTVTGLNKITTAWDKYNNGIRKHNISATVYDCSTGTVWFAPVGQCSIWDATNDRYMPAADGSSQKSTELWVRIDNLKNRDLTAKIGKNFIKANQIIEI